MRIGIDATALLVPVKTGIQYYTTSLILAMVKALPEYPHLELFIYFHSGDRFVDASRLSEYVPRLRPAKIREWRFSRGYRLALPMLAARDRLDFLHFPKPTSLHFYPCPTLLTVHDLCWARLPSHIVAGERSAGMADAKKAIQKAAGFIAVSNSTRDDLIAEYNVSPEQVWVTYEGVDEKFHPSLETVGAIRRRYNLDRYILCVSTLQRRKNLVRLLEAYANLLARDNISHKLVLVGSKGWGYEEVYAAVNRLALSEHILFPDYVPVEELPGLYAGTDLFVYPSLCEGFGLPILEAMACGAPVAVAQNSSLPEVAGEAGVYFDPASIEDMARKIGHILGNNDFKEELRCKGLAQAKKFSWQETARQTLIAYQMFHKQTGYK